MAAIGSRLGQHAAQRQALGLTPALQQSIKLLALSNLALAEILAEAVAENPLLEWADEPPAPSPGRHRVVHPANALRPLPAGLSRLFGAVPRGRSPAEAPAGGSAIAAPGPSLQDHLLQQLGADVGDPLDRAIGRAFIEALDESGYLTAGIKELAGRLGQGSERMEHVLRRLQQFDPPGVFARSLSECLALQLADHGRLDPPMQKLLENLDLLAAGDRAGLMKRCSVDKMQLDSMIAELRRLDPRPGLVFDREASPTIVPDLWIERTAQGGWQIELNGETMPRLNLNAHYPVPPGADAAAGRYLKERRAEARWLLRAIDRRSETLLQVAHEIVARQTDFLEGGPAGLKPLSRREIARHLNLHESTVGRAIANKYAATPRGALALTDFFAGRLATKKDVPGHAPAAVRQRIRRLVATEPAGRPLSDESLTILLRAEGIEIARRTVAKYREMLRIPGSSRRRRA